MEVIKKVNLQEKIAQIDLENDTVLAVNEVVYHGKKYKIEYEKVGVTLPYFIPVALGSSDQNFVYCSSNGNTYAKFGDIFKLITVVDVTNRPVISSIIVENIRYPLVIGGDGSAVYIRGEEAVSLQGDYTAEFVADNGEMLFLAKGKTIKFSTCGDMTDLVFSFDRAGQFSIEDGFGDIVGLATEDRKLIIFTKNAVFEFNPVGSRLDYSLKRIDGERLNVLPYSVKDVGDKIAFINGKKLCYFKDGKIYQTKSTLYKKEFEFCRTAAVDGSVYYITIIMETAPYFFHYRYDFTLDLECLVGFQAFTEMFDGGYIGGRHDELYKLAVKEVIEPSSFIIKELNDALSKKSLLKIIAFVSGSATLTIKGDCGKREITLREGLNQKRLNFPSINFSAEISDNTADFKIHEMQVKYRIKGE